MQIFLSYDEHDIDFAIELAAKLKAMHAMVWFDRDDASHTSEAAWQDAVRDAVKISDMLLLVASEASLAQGYIQEDWEYYIHNGRPVIVVQIEDIELPALLKQRNPIPFYNGDNAGNLNRLQLALLDQAGRISTDKWRRPPTKNE